ncbi:MAG: hypothetical protein FWD56_05500, partial [Bacteroidales bacterium]|nr:hypothetical protein [Bacteroidales bacterium]
MKKLLFIGICLAVTTMLMSCDKNKVLGTDDIGTGWPSSTTLAKYGLNGLQKPSGSTGAYFAEAGGVLAINF